MKTRYFLLYSLFISFCVVSITSYGKDIEQEIVLELGKGKVTIQPRGLEIAFQKKGSATVLPITTSGSNIFSLPVNITSASTIHEIEYKNGYKVQIAIINDRLDVKIYPTEDNVIKWPVIAENEYLDAYLIPEGEGLYVPRSDKKIRALLNNHIVTSTTSVPFLGYIYNDLSVTLILHNPYRTTTTLNDYSKGQSIEYDFRQRDGQKFYEISLAFSKRDVLEPSRIFKEFLKKGDKYVSMQQKIEKNPEISKLAGAMHIYVWGDGRTIKALQALHNLGITKAWIGYETKPKKIEEEKWNKTDYVNEEFIKEGKKLGYLIGVYDSYHTMQSPKDSDAFNTDFGEKFYPKGCVCGKEGKITKGFGGRGCAVSMTALDQINHKIVYDRVKNFIHQGINSYFLDCHGMLEVYDDYNPKHPQTILEDIAIRLKHLSYLSKQNLVVGSEGATAYTIPFLAFSHGNGSTLYNIHWPVARNQDFYGGWGPAKRPAIFFKSITVDEKYCIRYAPEYRAPLLQAVFHESIVTTDRWETPITKFINLYQDRFLLEFLYGFPSIWNLDLQAIKQYKNILQQLAKEFTPLHAKIMTKELTDFNYLTPDRKVQKATYGNKEVIITANFKDNQFEDIPKKSVKIFYKDTQETRIITPEKLRLSL